MNYLQLQDHGRLNGKLGVDERKLAEYFGEGNYITFYKKHFMKIESVTCLGPTEKQPVATIGEVDIMKPAIKLKFVCSRCGTEFNAPKYKCESYQTGMNEFEYTFSCPECHDRCYSHEEVK